MRLQPETFRSKGSTDMYWWVSEGLVNNTRRREVKALEALPKVLPCKHRCIITYDETDEWQLSNLGIEVIPVWKWLLE